MTAARCFAIVCVTAGLVRAQAVSLTVGHDDLDGVVVPGQDVNISFNIAHSGFYMVGRWRGDAAVSPNLGIAASPWYGVPIAPSPGFSGVIPGVPTLGSVIDSQFQHAPPLFVSGTHVPWTAPAFEFMRYTWTAPATPGVYAFNWTPHPQFPLVEGYATAVSIPLTPYPTTYVGTSLTVIPTAPSAGVLVGVAGFVGARRRR